MRPAQAWAQAWAGQPLDLAGHCYYQCDDARESVVGCSSKQDLQQPAVLSLLLKLKMTDRASSSNVAC